MIIIIIIIIERINRPTCCEESKKGGRRTAYPVQDKFGEDNQRKMQVLTGAQDSEAPTILGQQIPGHCQE
ncbi:hypothetical protein XPA_004098 [Xanthoria parietina]